MYLRKGRLHRGQEDHSALTTELYKALRAKGVTGEINVRMGRDSCFEVRAPRHKGNLPFLEFQGKMVKKMKAEIHGIFVPVC